MVWFLLRSLIMIYQIADIIHEDIKSGNVLAFENMSRFVAKVADFGFATCFQSHNDLISMPKSEPWNASERHDRLIKAEQGKQMDVYSFDMLCFWLVFKAGSFIDLSLPQDMTLEIGQFVSFERNRSEENLFQIWRMDNKLINWICWLIRQNSNFDNSKKNHLMLFFRSTLAFDPRSRCIKFNELFNLLVPNR